MFPLLVTDVGDILLLQCLISRCTYLFCGPFFFSFPLILGSFSKFVLFPGYGEIHAVNVREMIFIMLYVSFDMILAAYLLGNIAALIVKGSRTERFRDNMTELIKYMNRNNLDKHISAEIKRHLRLQYDRKYTEASVLKDIPFFLRTKVWIMYLCFNDGYISMEFDMSNYTPFFPSLC